MTNQRTMKLHNVEGKQRWCGPAAIAAIAGVTTDNAAALIRRLERRRMVTHTNIVEVSHALHELGFVIDRALRPCDGIPFRRWQNETYLERRDGVYLFSSGRHWRVIQSGLTVCGIQRQVGSWNLGPKPGAKVRDAWHIRRKVA